MNVPHFIQRGSVGMVCGLSLIGLSVVGVVAFAQDDKPEDKRVLEVTQAVPLRASEPPDADDTDQDEIDVKPEKAEKVNKAERDALRKERDALLKERADLDRKLAKISRALGEPTVSLFGDARAFTFNSEPLIELQRKSVQDALRSTQDSKKATEAYRRAAEEMRRSMKNQNFNKDTTEAMQRALEALERSGAANKEAQRFYFNSDSLKALPAVPELPALPNSPNFRYYFNDKSADTSKETARSKEFEASMRRFEQKMEAWQKDFEAKMKAWEKKMQERESKP